MTTKPRDIGPVTIKRTSEWGGTKLCSECRYCKPEQWLFGLVKSYHFATCLRTDVISPRGDNADYCSVQRKFHWLCGRDAKHFEPL